MYKEKTFTVKSRHNGGIYTIGESKLKAEPSDWELVVTKDTVDIVLDDLKTEEEVKRPPASKTYVKYTPRKTKK